jgi:hypothetical protein
MKYNYDVLEIDKYRSYELISEYHYSKVMPKLTKHFLGVFLEDDLVGVLTLGWGTQPRQTINKLFPGLGTESYYEIGKMCMHPDMPRNSESQMLSSVIKWMKQNTPEKLFLYTWADGIMGKPGYVYQSANFLYGGFIWTDIFVGPDGEKIHPRSTKQLLIENAQWCGRDKLYWLTHDFCEMKGIKRYRGKQFRYIMPLNKKAKKLLNDSTVTWGLNYPKDKDVTYKMRTYDGYVDSGPPPFDMSVVNVNQKNVKNFLR